MGDTKHHPRRPGDTPDPLTPDIHVSTLKPGFEWDRRKALKNARKHGITFEQAGTVFDDPTGRYGADPAHSTAEEVREHILGVADGTVLVVVFTRRAAGRSIRIISARRANRRERRTYQAHTKAD